MIVSKVTDSSTVSPGDRAEFHHYFTLICFVEVSIFQSNLPSQVCILCSWEEEEEGRKRKVLLYRTLGRATFLEEPSMGGDESSAFRNLGQLFWGGFCKETQFRCPEMGWVTQLPKCLAPCGRRNWVSHWHKHLESLTVGGVCTQRWGKREEVKNQNEMDS